MNESEARSILEAEAAAAGERLLWWGRPAAGRSALRALPASIFGVPFTGFALFWMWGAAGGLDGGSRAEGPWLLFPLFGLPFLVIGLGLVLSPLFTALAASRTLYAVTGGAIVVVKAGRSRRVERHPLPAEDVVRRSQRADGSGDLDVGRAEVATSKGPRSRTLTFVGIPDVARVERIVTDAARAWRDGLASAPAAGHPTAEARGPTAPGARHADLGGAPMVPPPRRAPGTLPGAPPYREGAPRRLPVLLLLVLGLLAGFAVALALAREGKLPAGWLEPAPAGTSTAAPADVAPEPAAPVKAPRPAGTAPAVPAPAAAPPPLHSGPISAACDAGDARECLRIARAAIDAGGLAQDPVLAVAAAGRGCDLGLALACATLAWILDGRAGAASDYPLLVRAGERGCDLGSGDACTQAGFALAYGKPGLPRDPARAEILLERACSDGHHPRACAALGDLLAKRGERARARAVLSGCCTWGDGGCCTARDRLGDGG